MQRAGPYYSISKDCFRGEYAGFRNYLGRDVSRPRRGVRSDLLCLCRSFVVVTLQNNRIKMGLLVLNADKGSAATRPPFQALFVTISLNPIAVIDLIVS